MTRKIVIVGGVAGGASAAARLRRLNEQDEIRMFERGGHISFANCGLPYYIGDTITSRERLLLQTPQAMKNRFGIDVHIRTEVTAIDRERKVVRTEQLDTREVVEYSYDVLILSPGAKPIVPDLPGIAEANNLFTLRNMADTDRMKAFVQERNPKHATIMGGGFIGVEMAENLRHLGVAVTLIDRNEQVLGALDPEMTRPVERHMELKGIELELGETVEAIRNNGSLVKLASGREFATDMIVLAIGVQPESQLAAMAGLEQGVRGSIRVNEHLRTSDPSIYAVGDAIEVMHKVLGMETVVPLAWEANRQGRLAADHISGLKSSYTGAYGTAIVKLFDLTAAVTGANEKMLRKLGVRYEAVHTHPSSHAGYYPGASPIAMKLLFEPETGRILGAQAVGADGADKRIDVIATAMRGGLTVHDLADLELAYAPPYSSAKDPVNMLGYVASNVLDGLVTTMQWHEVDAYVNGGGLLIDVRDPIEREMGFIPGSTNIPLNDLRSRLHDIPKDAPIVVSCQVGQRGYVAARLLSQHGYQVRNVDGGYKTYAAMFGGTAAKPTPPPAAANSAVQSAVHAATHEQAAAQEATTPEPVRITVDACGLQCPGPIMKVYETMNTLSDGDLLEVKASDFGFAADIAKWSEKSGHTLESLDTAGGVISAVVRKGQQLPSLSGNAAAKEGTTMVVFSGDLDKAIASFIIASGAAAMGKKVTMFFTFWGLNILRKPDGPAVKKSAIERMFGMMMPKGTKALPMSKMNMGGLGPRMIRYVMKSKNVESLESLMAGAIRSGVHIVACTMSMDIMGIKKEELIDGIDYAGVASYLGDAEDAGVNLFI
ncbi:NADPH-dependent 2,4-dienoyl-CoA reductase/sulfur reductase-like enzyme/peroxiredoxin family protein/rhodanese-related sulfurtransferase/TusA-related sulfurtransferase [Paenibacillus phyllosphaerae]|uniref:NADPH-dependent 2,4-dienoyl-CoA reductase/sulfur reductase-like enzyme/peroxiredoxin family protein/rhodanese-related sulfurtransferase/TusA-related sulfurtransferase n=1 Tax=Paenibacillus phyllosphaerae TaxID=274593 RepID=A0A7W5AU33_9BACL|nr:CoA-disulfide reductase [Paenibacillus phyllosphaerae]MBB3108647.1 NADPH-dependent 2,4-dienoyl-CoA reductase/sulfur reductase-like enzyme/peroxiredoxin family protein/rhodanese-related sulfurtransferase/TusA-related sulfurtransferase [Paenibacillus phyllosphaerae]